MRDIVSYIKSGDLNAFKELFEDYYVMLCVFAARYLKDDEQCKDVAQEALSGYWERREDFNDIYKVKGYLYTVTRNRCLNILRHVKVSQGYLKEYEEELESECTFEDHVIEQETYLIVRKAVDSLPPQMRTIIRYALDGLKNPQIAKEMGIGEGTVRSLKQTAYRKLREQLKEHFYVLLFL
ncbi:RNA polymerase sigma factor [Butyricimonas paravirosa]|uniref:RNA polymerase sigma factor n=1 Tax=Butyricimonas paravirosa TaxID=1472417 RepID=UPI00210BCD4D|nr:RNA polymerase sigma-70 factor [Butyricimonas paravirosa]MCQ4873602.1 RNA polymerase sigma-70 factor [Butyricimonas paravirosa]